LKPLRHPFLIPRSHTLRPHFPRSRGPRFAGLAGDCKRTAASTRKLPGLCGSPKGYLMRVWPEASNPHPSPLPAGAQNARRGTTPSAAPDSTGTPIRSAFPSQAGTSRKSGASTARSKDDLPLSQTRKPGE
jgi:hypothetical protein